MVLRKKSEIAGNWNGNNPCQNLTFNKDAMALCQPPGVGAHVYHWNSGHGLQAGDEFEEKCGRSFWLG